MEPIFDFKTTFNLASGASGQIFVEDQSTYDPNDPDTAISSVVTVTDPVVDLLPSSLIDNDVSLIGSPIDLPVDYDQNVLKGNYSVKVTTTIVNKFYEYAIIGSTTGANPTIYVDGNVTGPIPTTLDIVNAVSGNGTYNIVSIVYNAAQSRTEFEIDVDPGSIITTGEINFRYTTEYVTEYVYDYCYDPATVKINVIASCVTSEIISKDLTQYGDYETLTRTHTLRYPEGLEDQFPDVVTPLQTNRVVPIYTKTWTSIVESEVVYVEEDGLIIQDVLKGSAEYEVDCSINFCKLYECLKNFYNMWQEVKKDNPVQAKNMAYNYGQLNALLHLAKISAECGKNEDLRCWYKQIYNLLNAYNCACNCEEQDSSLPTLVEGVAACDCEGAVVVDTSGNGILVDVQVQNNTTTYVLSLDQSVLDGLDGEDGLGYDNMTSAAAFDESLVPFSTVLTITVEKAVTAGTRLRFTRVGDVTKYIEGVVTAYDVNSGATAINFEYASAAAGGVAPSGYSVTVIGDRGVDGTKGLGYENMTSTSVIVTGTALPFSDSLTITSQKAVTAGTRLRFARQAAPTIQWIEGVVTAYNVNTGATDIDFDKKSSSFGNANDWNVTVIGEPGASALTLVDNLGSGAEVFAQVNGSTAELRSLVGQFGLAGPDGVVQTADGILLNPLTEDNYVDVYSGGVGTSPVFNYGTLTGEALPNPGTINTSRTKVGYHDFNDFIFVQFQLIIDDFRLTHGSNNWSLAFPTIEILGLPLTGTPSPIQGIFSPRYIGSMNMTYFNNLPAPTSNPEVVMESRRDWRWTAGVGKLVSSQSGDFGNRLPITPYPDPVSLVFIGAFIMRKD